MAIQPAMVASGVVCATALAIGSGFIAPINGAAGGFVGLLAVISGVVFVGLIEDS